MYNDTATTEIYTLSLHDALPICVTDKAAKLQVGFDGNTISVAGRAKAENDAIYSIGGEKVVNLKSWNGSPVNVGSLSNGMYILKVNNKSFKFIKK